MSGCRVEISANTYTMTGQPVEMPWPARESPLSPYMKPGDGVLDIGANVGEFTREFAARVGVSGMVLAVEPDIHTATLNRLFAKDLPQVQVLVAAVTSRSGVVNICKDAQNPRRHSLWRHNLTHDSPDTMLVPAVTVDDLADAVPNLTAIKVDIQGAEGAMLEGAHKTLQRRHVTWCVELWPEGLAVSGWTVREVATHLKGYGWHPVGLTWADVHERADKKPAGVQNVVLRHD